MKTSKLLLVMTALAVGAWIFYDVCRRRAPIPSETAARAHEQPSFPHLSGPRSHPRASTLPDPATNNYLSNILARVLNGDEEIKLTLDQVEPFLRDNKRSAESLIGAFRATGDKTLLREALEKYPNDPKVCCAACVDMLHDKNLSDAVRQQRLDSFKKASPDNALPNYLAAANLFKSGRTDDAVREISEAAGKLKYRDFSSEFIQNTEEAYRAAGSSEIEAKAVAAFNLPLSQLSTLKRLGQNLGDLAALYQQSGDTASAQAALQMGLTLARQVGTEKSPNCMIDNLVGIAIEAQILERMDPSSPCGSTATVKDRLEELVRQRQTIKDLGKNNLSFMQGMSEQDIVSYLDRVKVSGEMDAMRWAMNRQKLP